MGRLTAIIITAGFAVSGIAATLAADTLAVSSFAHRQDGLDRVFTFEVTNTAPQEVVVYGRLIVLNVYDTSPPLSISVQSMRIAAGETVQTDVRWSDAPLVGQVRALLVLNGGPGTTSIVDYEFWIFPWQAFIILTGVFLVLSGIAMGALGFMGRLRRKKPIEGPGPARSEKLATDEHAPVPKPAETKKHLKKPKRKKYPSGMTGYVIEFGDTVVTVANRFGVTWEDVVRTNRLKPPYPLKPGAEILIPIHALRRPEEGNDTDV